MREATRRHCLQMSGEELVLPKTLRCNTLDSSTKIENYGTKAPICPLWRKDNFRRELLRDCDIHRIVVLVLMACRSVVAGDRNQRFLRLVEREIPKLAA